ncbi:MAG: class I SAM-dependent methyltransferase, partial [Sandaracinaceae bacterium]|nr:class I SAM-dependent methyltransferase [Sandaracinaceae bacterium]
MSRYEDVPYRGLPVLASAPARLAWTSLVHGGPVPSLDVAHVLELGCGDGANLLPLAAHHPNWTCVGLDLSPSAIARARALASKASLQNAKFDEADVAALELEPTHRFVLAHGLYSWIDPPRREALLSAIAHALAPDGLAYVSFNAQPGWSARGRVRDLLVRARTADLEQARALLGSLRERTSDDVWGQLLGHELDRAIQASDDYLVHEYLAEHNDAFWIGDFVRDAERAGLRWIGDSQFDLQEGRGFTAIASELSGDPMQIEERADLLGYRQLRCAV